MDTCAKRWENEKTLEIGNVSWRAGDFITSLTADKRPMQVSRETKARVKTRHKLHK